MIDYRKKWIKNINKYIWCECKCRFDGRKCNWDQLWNSGICQCECKKRHVCEKDYIWNPSRCSYKNEKYLASIEDNLAITWD